ncbi:PID-CTERM protein-sorting domain-containing protein [Lacinutrix sp. Bg11-31]|uniref:PID-CTERM protein-sorting domain-containing protein n=1 Tax=Lacinutrix sp. Bg11-31 TaxID=2057808 RepID=UPI0018E29108|nr:hypothetical protein [Lacinutrix sp. Bg11-31]
MIQNKKIFASILFLLISFVCSAQTPPPPPLGPAGPVGLPIDSGLIALFAVGVLYGIYKMYRLKKKAI